MSGAELLRGALGEDSRRGLRLPVHLSATVGSSRIGKWHGSLEDISVHGCRIATVGRFDHGAHVVVTIPTLTPRGATVCWSSNRAIGLRFAAALHPTVVDRIATLGRPAADPPA